ncbi:hypothetical protein [Psychroserpens damuponensis]|uniref:hypothetical protein n=1 Tax=Psychroserpens damuponensis TaxID=943936 RepID=UPI00058E8440|nr:hypothetical protein [Psychroserpens damuponensis]
MHVFYAQGGGLGHLTRVDTLIKTLDIPKREVIIITPSVFTNYFKGYQFVRLRWDEHHYDWAKTIVHTLKKYPVTRFYVDTFPFGLKGELNLVYSTFPKLTYIYISRVLKWDFYTSTVTQKASIIFYNTLLLEPLYDAHLNWITSHSTSVTPITLKRESLTPICYMKSAYVLVVHSGGKDDVLKICKQAIEDYKTQNSIKIVVFTQVHVHIENDNVVVKNDVYPVSQYFENAIKIYTAGGFNSMHELKNYKEKHVAVALNKLYDDQEFRILNL